jgi:hypothetical protein
LLIMAIVQIIPIGPPWDGHFRFSTRMPAAVCSMPNPLYGMRISLLLVFHATRLNCHKWS